VLIGKTKVSGTEYDIFSGIGSCHEWHCRLGRRELGSRGGRGFGLIIGSWFGYWSDQFWSSFIRYRFGAPFAMSHLFTASHELTSKKIKRFPHAALNAAR